MIKECGPDDFENIYTIINDAAHAYAGVIPADRWREPYMPRAELRSEIDAGVDFWGWEEDGDLVAVMGIQPVKDVTLIRHAYTLPCHQRRGLGSRLLQFLVGRIDGPVLVGTWEDAGWAVAFYCKHGFTQVTRKQTERLLATYWSIPERQIETSVVLANHIWLESAGDDGT